MVTQVVTPEVRFARGGNVGGDGGGNVKIGSHFNHVSSVTSVTSLKKNRGRGRVYRGTRRGGLGGDVVAGCPTSSSTHPARGVGCGGGPGRRGRV